MGCEVTYPTPIHGPDIAYPKRDIVAGLGGRVVHFPHLMGLNVIYCAAHAGFPDYEPLGGGKAVADYLVDCWQSDPDVRLELVSPHATALTLAKPLVAMSELEYARFCRQFEHAATDAIRRHDPREWVVLINDISEGPSFAELDAAGYRMAAIFHVDVVEFFTRFYLRNWVRPETVARQRWFRWMPDVLRLVFEKQYQCVRHCRRLLAPSAPMREMVQRCYPAESAGKVVVTPWGNVAPQREPDRRTIADLGIAEDEIVVVTMSRLSREKGIERLLAALPFVRDTGRPWRVLICGAAAYMGGRAYEARLRRIASRLDGCGRVRFTGHLTGERKVAVLDRADIFVSCSLHESYGLTIAEAEAAGCRVVSHGHYGASGTVVDCGLPVALAAALEKLIAAGRKHSKPIIASDGRESVRRLTADRVADVLRECAV